MNVFIIPSWYPTAALPIAGIFNKEQAEAMAHIFPASNFALSTWGSHDPDLQLWAKDHFRNVVKLARFSTKRPSHKKLGPNLTEYYSPALTWSRALFGGNIQEITRTCEKHLLDFQQQKGSIDIIHAHTGYPGGWVAMKLSKKYGIPYIITEHMSPFPFPSFLTKGGKINNWLLLPFLGSSINIAVSPQQKEKMEGWHIPRLEYIPNLTNEEFYKPAPQEVKAAEPFTFFTLGRLDPQKGIPYLLEAFKLLIQRHPHARLRIGGEGTEKLKYQAIADKLGINDQLTWLGLLDRNRSLKEYQSCDAFVLPSLHENLPLVLIEAMACGKPLISTRCGGPESIINAKNGLLVAPANSSELAETMQKMMETRYDYSDESIRADFCRRYSRKVVCLQIMDTYLRAIKTAAAN